MYCPNCGVQTKSDFCPSCGFEMALAKSNVSKYNAQGFMQSRKIAKYTEAELKEMDKKADIAVATMTAGGVATGLVPIVVDIPAFATALGVGVVALGKCYMYEITKEEAADLIRQFFKAASFSLAMAFVGTKITLSAFKITPFAPVVYISDAVICGSIAFAVGQTAKNFLSRKAQGKTASPEEIKVWMEEGRKEGKKVARRIAEKKAKELEKKLKKK